MFFLYYLSNRFSFSSNSLAVTISSVTAFLLVGSPHETEKPGQVPGQVLEDRGTTGEFHQQRPANLSTLVKNYHLYLYLK